VVHAFGGNGAGAGAICQAILMICPQVGQSWSDSVSHHYLCENTFRGIFDQLLNLSTNAQLMAMGATNFNCNSLDIEPLAGKGIEEYALLGEAQPILAKE